MNNRTVLYGSMAMVAVLVLSNYVVRFTLGQWLTWAAFTYPLSFLVIDCVNRAGGVAAAKKVVTIGFMIGVPLSFFFILAEPNATWKEALQVSFASGLAFVAGQLTDVFIFDRVRRLVWWMPPLLSSTPASIVDSFVFFPLAFYGTQLDWFNLTVGDLGAKLAMVLILLPLYRLFLKLVFSPKADAPTTIT